MVKLRDAIPRLIVVGIAVGFVAMLALLGPTESKTSQGSSSASVSSGCAGSCIISAATQMYRAFAWGHHYTVTQGLPRELRTRHNVSPIYISVNGKLNRAPAD